jgi:protein-tyrosine phosphatase
MSHIFDGVWIGSRSDAMNDATLDALDLQCITHVLNVANNAPTMMHLSSRRKYLRLGIDDFDDVTRILDDSMAFIDTAKEDGGQVLIHCKMGMNRSAAVAFAHILRNHDSKTSLQLIASARKGARPCPWFIHQIEKWKSESVS